MTLSEGGESAEGSLPPVRGSVSWRRGRGGWGGGGVVPVPWYCGIVGI